MNLIKQLIVKYVGNYKETTWLSGFSPVFSLFLINGENI